MSTLSISTADILAHRAGRKAAGLVGCKDGSDGPLHSLSGISWRPADPMDPHCFCFDCRETWDADALIDLHLLQNGHDGAVHTYASLVFPKATPTTTSSSSVATATEVSSSLAPVHIPAEVGLSNVLPALIIPMSLPDPVPSHEHPILQSISRLISDIQSEQVRAMDLKRRATFASDPQEKQRIVEASYQYEMYCEQAMVRLQMMDADFRAHMAFWE